MGNPRAIPRTSALPTYVVGTLLAITAYYLVPGGPVPRIALYCAVDLSSALAILWGVRRHRPVHRLPWLLLAVAQLSFVAADGVFYFLVQVLSSTAFPTIADALYLVHYPVYAVALLLLVRRRTPSRDQASLIDAAVITLGAALLSWVFLLEPSTRTSGLTVLGRVVSMSYPLGDLLVLAIAVRLALGTGARSMAYRLLIGSLVLCLASNTCYGLMLLAGTYQPGNFLSGSWMLCFVLLGAAALHPSMRRLEEPTPVGEMHAGWARLSLLAGASLMTPATMMIQTLRDRPVNIPVVAAASTGMFLLVVARMAGLVAEQRRVAITDALTGLSNRRFLEATLRREVSKATRDGDDLSLLIVDVDHFKRVNDTYGHPAGDEVLYQIAGRLAAFARASDVTARYGGEEFAVLLAHTGLTELTAAAERLRRTVADNPVCTPNGEWLSITVSVGAAALPAHGRDADSLVGVADAALYAAKRLGRNRVKIGLGGDGAASDQALPDHAVLAYLERLADEIDAGFSAHEHSTAVSRWAGMVAEQLRLGPDVRAGCELAGRLHDIGKVVVPDEILHKPGPLTNLEWELMRQHPAQGARLVGLSPRLSRIATIIRQHHERYDGTGYPDRRAGEDIIVEARVLAVCDSWAAMRSDRCYQSALPLETARRELVEGRGGQFDPEVVDAFLELERVGAIGELYRRGEDADDLPATPAPAHAATSLQQVTGSPTP
jgi:two-component system cell cycle response regulator